MIPDYPKIYHIVHVDRLKSIVSEGCLWCDAEVQYRRTDGTTIGMHDIKRRRLEFLTLSNYPDLYIGECFPFYFCPRPIMLYMIYKGNTINLDYREGQDEIIHLQADMYNVIKWANKKGHRWAFTLSNAGSNFFEDRCNIESLHEVDWDAVNARDWRNCKDEKQAEFLVENSLPWKLIEYIGVYKWSVYKRANENISNNDHHPPIEIRKDWYY